MPHVATITSIEGDISATDDNREELISESTVESNIESDNIIMETQLEGDCVGESASDSVVLDSEANVAHSEGVVVENGNIEISSQSSLKEAIIVENESSNTTTGERIRATLFIESPSVDIFGDSIPGSNAESENIVSDGDHEGTPTATESVEFSRDEVFDDDDLLPDKNITMPDEVPQYYSPRDIRPFLGFDYYMTKADILIIHAVTADEIINNFSIILNQKLKYYLRKHYPDDFTERDDIDLSFEPLIQRELRRSMDMTFAYARNELSIDHAIAEWALGQQSKFRIDYGMEEEVRVVDSETTTEEGTVVVDDDNSTQSTPQSKLIPTKKFWYESENLLSILRYKIHLMIFIHFDNFYHYLDFLLFYRLTHYSIISFSNFDYCVPYVYHPRDPIRYRENGDKVDILLKSPYFIKWFAKNICIEHNKLIPIPLGPKWQFHSPIIFAEDLTIMKRIYIRYGIYPMLYFKNFTIPEYQDSINALNIFKPKKDKLLYFHFHTVTTDDPFCLEYTNLRNDLWVWLQEQGVPNAPVRSPKGYLDELSRYKFAIAPPGKGLDTHRAWEALMVGTIPIVLTSALDSLFRGLPVLIVDDYKVLTEEFLYASYNYFHEYPDEFSFEKIFTPYWDRVFEEVTRLDDVE